MVTVTAMVMLMVRVTVTGIADDYSHILAIADDYSHILASCHGLGLGYACIDALLALACESIDERHLQECHRPPQPIWVELRLRTSVRLREGEGQREA